MSVYTKRILVLGSVHEARKPFSEEAARIAYSNGFSGTAYLVGMDSISKVEAAVSRRRERFGADSIAIANTGALFDRLNTVMRMANGTNDIIIVYDWYCTYPVFDANELSEDVRRACEKMFGAYMRNFGFDYVVAVDKDIEHVPHLEWFEKTSGMKWEEVLDVEGSPRTLAELIARA